MRRPFAFTPAILAISHRTAVCAAIAAAPMLAAAASFPLLQGGDAAAGVSATLETDAPALSLERDLTASLLVEAADGGRVEIPSIDELRARFEGFSIAEGYTRGERTDGRIEIRWRLRADPAARRYRLGPFAIAAIDAQGRRTFVAGPVLFPVSPMPEAAGGMELPLRRLFVWPSPRQAMEWLLAALAAAGALALLAMALRRIRRAVRIRLMSPAERALHELTQLLGRGLPERGLFKDYYVELTHVVRRYIERAYGIRAPRQTTEEFLASARGDTRFTAESLSQLSEFLQSADMVKFAGLSATVEMAREAAGAAKRYVERDSAAGHAAAGKGGPQ